VKRDTKVKKEEGRGEKGRKGDTKFLRKRMK
jgi:hypothetical protein